MNETAVPETKKPKTFLWQALLLPLYVVLSAVAFIFPMFPENPIIYLESEAVLAGSFSGYGLAFHFNSSTFFFVFTAISWVYLFVVGFCMAFLPNLRKVKTANLLLFPGFGLNSLTTSLCLTFIGKNVNELDSAFRAANQVSQTLDVTSVVSLVEPSFYVLGIVPILVLMWWLLVNVFNYQPKKKKSS